MVTWDHSQLPYKSLCQSSCPCVCPVHQVIVHEVPGQELEVEVYDKDTDQDDFLGRYIMHSSCLLCAYVESRIVTFHVSPLMASWKRYTTCFSEAYSCHLKVTASSTATSAFYAIIL